MMMFIDGYKERPDQKLENVGYLLLDEALGEYDGEYVKVKTVEE